MRDGPTTHAIVPVKTFARAKTRLAQVLSPEARRALARAMLLDVIAALRGSRGLARVWVVSLDREILAGASRLGAAPLEEKFDMGLNRALRFATRTATEAGAGRVLIVPSDVPLVTPADIDALLAAGRARGPRSVIAVPSRDGAGTNALLRTPPAVIPPRFGANSLPRHAREAARRGIPFVLRRAPRMMLDVDTPAELVLLSRRARGHTARALRRLGFL